jgi:hypothetical protein
MSKIVINHAPGGIVLDVDMLQRFIEQARAADDGDADAQLCLPASAKYVAEAMARLLDQP